MATSSQRAADDGRYHGITMPAVPPHVDHARRDPMSRPPSPPFTLAPAAPQARVAERARSSRNLACVTSIVRVADVGDVGDVGLVGLVGLVDELPIAGGEHGIYRSCGRRPDARPRTSDLRP
jgi:hypothetical protein